VGHTAGSQGSGSQLQVEAPRRHPERTASVSQCPRYVRPSQSRLAEPRRHLCLALYQCHSCPAPAVRSVLAALSLTVWRADWGTAKVHNIMSRARPLRYALLLAILIHRVVLSCHAQLCVERFANSSWNMASVFFLPPGIVSRCTYRHARPVPVS